MPAPSYTYTLTNNTVADANNVMQNFNDILNGVTDASKDISVSALTAAGNVSFTGSSITLGNASSDDLTITASLASTINIKTTASYNIGSASLGLAGIYFGANSQTVRIAPSGSMSATWTLTLPVTAGSNLQVLQTDGSGVSSWQTRLATPTTSGFITTHVPTVASSTVTKTNTDYTILDTDGYNLILVAAGGAQRTITLPTVADNNGRIITIRKISGAGTVLVDGEGSEGFDGGAYTQTVINEAYGYITIQSDGSSWHVLAAQDYIESKGTAGSVDSTTANLANFSVPAGIWLLTGNVSANLLTGITYMRASITSTTGGDGTNGDSMSNQAGNASAGGGQAYVELRVVLTTATTYYLTGKSNTANTVGFKFAAMRLG